MTRAAWVCCAALLVCRGAGGLAEKRRRGRRVAGPAVVGSGARRWRRPAGHGRVCCAALLVCRGAGGLTEKRRRGRRRAGPVPNGSGARRWPARRGGEGGEGLGPRASGPVPAGGGGRRGRRGRGGAGRCSRARYGAGRRDDRARMTRSSGVLWEFGHDRHDLRGRLRHVGHSGRGDWQVPPPCSGRARAGRRPRGGARSRALARPRWCAGSGVGGDDASLVAPGRRLRVLHPPMGWTFGGLCPFCGRPRRARRPRDARKVDFGAVFAPFGALRVPSPPRRECGPTGNSGVGGQNTPQFFVSWNDGARVVPRGGAEAGAVARTCISWPRSGRMTAAGSPASGPADNRAVARRARPHAAGAGGHRPDHLRPGAVGVVAALRRPPSPASTRPGGRRRHPAVPSPPSSAAATGEHPARWAQARPCAAFAAAFP
ncbi:hypothetical protein EKD16_06960 [Streptomonospora litoralis]|uniref:Uncharacterized protein n=1 Tax=Streptomonospora litoralis TaxID=2498135 RepID=A0A4P6PY89_9ACTN|nr:hypothetical protein EKD16_06960 [Streptomonospora litoralis]